MPRNGVNDQVGGPRTRRRSTFSSSHRTDPADQSANGSARCHRRLQSRESIAASPDWRDRPHRRAMACSRNQSLRSVGTHWPGPRPQHRARIGTSQIGGRSITSRTILRSFQSAMRTSPHADDFHGPRPVQGEVSKRPGSRTDHSLVTVSALVEASRSKELQHHLLRAVQNGHHKEELIEADHAPGVLCRVACCREHRQDLGTARRRLSRPEGEGSAYPRPRRAAALSGQADNLAPVTGTLTDHLIVPHRTHGGRARSVGR